MWGQEVCGKSAMNLKLLQKISLSKEAHIKCSEHSITLKDFAAVVLALLLCNFSLR